MNTNYCLLFMLLLLPLIHLKSQSQVVEGFVEEAFKGSEVIKQMEFKLDRSLYALEEAKGLFLPSVTLNGTYTLAAGGRSIAFPIGDLLNPVYSTLNELTQSNSFPQLENVSENFNPNNFYDVKLRTTYPLINPAIRLNQEIKDLEIKIGMSGIDIYKEELRKNVRLAYFQYLQARQVVTIYENAIDLLSENLRVNQKLFENGMANPTVVNRSENEITKVREQLTQAESQVKNAAAYFNFLLNKPFTAPIIEDEALSNLNYPFPGDIPGDTKGREELNQIKTVENIQATALKISQTYKTPKVNAFVDLGSQGFDFNVGNGSLYALGGLSLEMPIYSGNRNKQLVKMAEMDLAASNIQLQDIADQLALQLETSKTNYYTALELFNSIKTQVATASRYFNDTVVRYKAGTALYIEYLEARNELTTIELQQTIRLFDVWSKWTEVQRALEK